jgi:DNA-binding GntR family transcriptional regulator
MKAELSRLDRITEVYHTLRELIVHGRLAPGARVIEAEVADRLNVSRTPVRSALHWLRQEGYIRETNTVGSEGGSGGRRTRLIVAPLTREDASELFHIVGHIEGLAGWYAAQLGSAPRGRLVAQLRVINADLRKTAEADRPDGNAIFDLDDAFHGEYVRAPARQRVLALHAAIKPQAERYIRVYISALVDEIMTSVEEHAAIIEEIEAGAPDGAQRAVQTNWRNAARRVGPVIDRSGERGSW